MKGVVPPNSWVLVDDDLLRLGSCTMVMNPKSARHAVMGLVNVRGVHGILTGRLTPFKSPCIISAL